MLRRADLRAHAGFRHGGAEGGAPEFGWGISGQGVRVCRGSKPHVRPELPGHHQPKRPDTRQGREPHQLKRAERLQAPSCWDAKHPDGSETPAGRQPKRFDLRQSRWCHQPKRGDAGKAPRCQRPKRPTMTEALVSQQPKLRETVKTPGCHEPTGGETFHAPRCRQPKAGEAPDSPGCGQPLAGDDPDLPFPLNARGFSAGEAQEPQFRNWCAKGQRFTHTECADYFTRRCNTACAKSGGRAGRC